MSTVVTVAKSKVTRCDWMITLIKQGQQAQHDEIRGDEGQAAAWALNMSAKNGGAKIVAPGDVMKILRDL